MGTLFVMLLLALIFWPVTILFGLGFLLNYLFPSGIDWIGVIFCLIALFVFGLTFYENYEGVNRKGRVR